MHCNRDKCPIKEESEWTSQMQRLEHRLLHQSMPLIPAIFMTFRLTGAQIQGCDKRGRLRTEGYGWVSLATMSLGVQEHAITTWRPVQPSAASTFRSMLQGDGTTFGWLEL